MWTEGIQHLRVLAGGGSGFAEAAIGALGVVLAAAITVFAGTFQKTRTPPDTLRLESELRRRAERAETANERKDVEIDRLTELLLTYRIDPHSGERMAPA